MSQKKKRLESIVGWIDNGTLILCFVMKNNIFLASCGAECYTVVLRGVHLGLEPLLIAKSNHQS
jgi:hypothetical protein